MKIPVQCRPEHHGYLPRWTCRGLEVIVAWIGDGADKEVIVLQCWPLESVNMMMTLMLAMIFCVSRVAMLLMLVLIVFRLQDNSPAGREATPVHIELISFEEEPTKDRQDCQVMTVRQVDYSVCHLSPLRFPS